MATTSSLTPQYADLTAEQDTYSGLPRDPAVPTNIIEQNLMSTTSKAAECFVYQRFSSQLQAYLVDYVNKSYSDFPIYH